MRLRAAGAWLAALALTAAGAGAAAAASTRPDAAAARALAAWLVPGALPSPVAAPDGSSAFELVLPEVVEQRPLVLLITGSAQGWFADRGVPPSPWTTRPPAQRLVSFRVFDPAGGSLDCGRALLEPTLDGGDLVFGALGDVQLFDGREVPRACAVVEAPAGPPDPWEPRAVTVRLAVREPAGGEGEEDPPARVHRWRERWGFDGPVPVPDEDELGDEAPQRPVAERPWLVLRRDARGREGLEVGPWPVPREGWPREAAGWALAEPRLELLDSERRGELSRLRLRAPDLASFRRVLATIERTTRPRKVSPQRPDEEGRIPFLVEWEPDGGGAPAPAGPSTEVVEAGPRAARAVAERLAPFLLEGAEPMRARSPDESPAFFLVRPGAGSGEEDEPAAQLQVTGVLDGSFTELGGPPRLPGQAPAAQRLAGLRLLEPNGELRCGRALLTPVLVGGELVFGGLRQLELEEAEAVPRACGALVRLEPTEENEELRAASWARRLLVRRESRDGEAIEAWWETTAYRLVGESAERVGEALRTPADPSTSAWLHLRRSGVDEEELVVGAESDGTDLDEVPELAALLDELPEMELLRLDRRGPRWLLEARLPDRGSAIRALRLLRERLPLVEIRMERAAPAPGPAREAGSAALIRAAFAPLR